MGDRSRGRRAVATLDPQVPHDAALDLKRAVRDQLIVINPCDHAELPKHIDFLRRTLTVEETIVEASTKHSPTGERYLRQPFPKDNEPRTFGVRHDWLDTIAEHIRSHDLGRDELLFATTVGTPISRYTFRTHVWLPAVKASAVGFAVRINDLSHAHASWLLAGGSDLKSVMEQMGHAQIQTTQRYLHALP